MCVVLMFPNAPPPLLSINTKHLSTDWPDITLTLVKNNQLTTKACGQKPIKNHVGVRFKQVNFFSPKQTDNVILFLREAYILPGIEI